jgi:hypothetical protein
VVTKATSICWSSILLCDGGAGSSLLGTFSIIACGTGLKHTHFLVSSDTPSSKLSSNIAWVATSQGICHLIVASATCVHTSGASKSSSLCVTVMGATMVCS